MISKLLEDKQKYKFYLLQYKTFTISSQTIFLWL